MIHNPPRRASNVAAVLVLGFVVGLVAEFGIDLFLDFTVTVHSLSEADAITFAVSLLLGLIVGGVMFLARARHYGVAALAGVSVVVSGVIADELATPVYFAIRHLPYRTEFVTAYFTHARPMFWVGNLCSFALAAGVTALRVRQVRAADDPPGGGSLGTGPGGMPMPAWAPPPGNPPPQPGAWHAQPPYGGTAPGDAPHGGPYGNGPYGAPPQTPYPPQAPYGPPS